MDDLVSVVIPTCDRPESLQRAIQSVKKQTYKNIEIIVIDDKTLTATEARNKGIGQSKGKYIAFLDDDDEWLPTKIEKQMEMFKEHCSAELVICWIDDRRFDEQYIDKYKEYTILSEVLEMFRLSSTSSYMFRASTLKNLGGFDERFPSAQEYDLAIRVAVLSPVYCVQEVLVIQKSAKNQITKDWSKKRKGIRMIWKHHKVLYRTFGLTGYIVFRFKFFGIATLYLFAHLFGERIYKIIIPYKRRTT